MSAVQVLVATMECRDEIRLLQGMGARDSAVVVNQIARPTAPLRHSTEGPWVYAEQEGRGLSRSRNRSLDLASSEYCLLADDDEVLHSQYEERVASAFANNPQLDVIAFVVNWHDSVRKATLRAGRLKRWQLMRVSSVQIAFRLDRVRASGVRFDERFGAGSEFIMGEELIFLTDLHRAGLKIGHVPIEVAHLTPAESSWFRGYSSEVFKARGASFRRAGGWWGGLYAAQWVVRKRRLYAPAKSMCQAWLDTRKGAREWTRRNPGR